MSSRLFRAGVLSEEKRVYRDVFEREFDPDERVESKLLACRLHVSYWTLRGMVLWGFFMPLGKASFNEAIDWLDENRDFSATKAYKKRAKELNTRKG